MIALGFDTSTAVGSVAIAREDEIMDREIIDTGLDHASHLLPALDALLRRQGLDLAEVDVIGVGIGPGSFTGCRVGVAFARGFAFAANKPLIGVSSLEAVADKAEDHPGAIVVIVDGRMKAFYYAAYRRRRETLHILKAPAVGRLDEIDIAGLDNTLIIGPDNEQRHEEYKRHFPAAVVPQVSVYPDAGYIALKAASEYEAGKYVAGQPVVPIYLRPVYAEMKKPKI